MIVMKWICTSITQETDHPFLNFFTAHYRIEDENGSRDYSYFFVSRHSKERVLTMLSDKSFRPDGVLCALYQIHEGKPRFLLIRQFRPAINRYIYDFPTGLMDETDESEITAVRREIKEESGAIITDIEKLIPASTTSCGLTDEMVSVYLARVDHIEETALEDTEDIKASFYSLDEIKKIKDDPEIYAGAVSRLTMLYLIGRFSESNN